MNKDNCECCGLEFIPHKNTINWQRFCSKKCKDKYHFKYITKECIICSKKFKPTTSQKTCSDGCKSKVIKKKYIKPRVEKKIKKCCICNENFIGPYNKLTCSDDCKKEKFFNDYSIEKKCEICSEKFLTPSKQKKTCSDECRHKLSGLKNKGNTWIMSEEARKKISIGRKKYLSTKEGKEQLISSVRLSWKNEETRKKRLTQERADKISKTGKLLYSLGIKKPRNSNLKKYLYKNIYFRSSWEVRMAKWLDNNKITWEYESDKCIHRLKNGGTYIVDFYLPELKKWIEVKGWWDEKSIYKCNDFLEEKGWDSLFIVDENNIDNIDLDILFYEYTDSFNQAVDRQIKESKGEI